MSNYLSKLRITDAEGENHLVKLKDTETLALASEINANLGRLSGVVEQNTSDISQNTTDIGNLNIAVGQNTANITQINNRINAHRFFFVSDYGAVGDGVTDDTAAIQAAINACNGNGDVVFDPLVYRITEPLVITKSFTRLCGYVKKAREIYPVIKADYTSGDVIHIGDGGNTFVEGVEISKLNITRSNMGVLGSKTIDVDGCLYTTIEECGFSKSQYGLYGKAINGLFVNDCHGTTGGDLTSNDSVYGIYIDGDNAVGNSGLVVHNYIYYGYETPNAISHAIYCKATAQGGDIRIYDLEASGGVNYGVVIDAGSGFASDIIIDGISMDAILTSGIYVYGTANYDHQNCNISNAWLRLDSAGAHGVGIERFENVNIVNLSVNGADVVGATDMAGIYLVNANNFNVTNMQVTNFANKLMQITNCICGQVTGLISRIDDTHAWVSNSTGILFENCYTAGTIFCGSPNTRCYKNNCIDGSSNTAIKVNITDSYVNTGAGATHQFTAKINGITASSGEIAWYVSGGRSTNTGVSSSGLLTVGADETAPLLIVTATSIVNTDVRDYCPVNVY